MPKCKYCGKKIQKGKFCGKEHYTAFRKEEGVKIHESKELAKMDDSNICVMCHKRMPKDRISAYCEECELHCEYTTEDTLNY